MRLLGWGVSLYPKGGPMPTPLLNPSALQGPGSLLASMFYDRSWKVLFPQEKLRVSCLNF